MGKYINYKHVKCRLYYHIIFSTKYRRKLLNPIKDDILRYMKESETKDFKIMIQNIDKDHIHLLVHLKPSVSISDIVHRLKQQSTYYVWKEHNNYMNKWYWSGKHYLWTRGYFCSTIGDVSKEKIIEYIENQG